jgi:acetoin utilization deacetylase AcuC-like enzyme
MFSEDRFSKRGNKMKIIFSEKCLEYSWLGHIERPERIRKALELLRQYEFLEPKPASQQDLLTVHSREYVELIKNAEAGSFLEGTHPHLQTFTNTRCSLLVQRYWLPKKTAFLS